jgi:hypothetical protein
MRVTKFLQHIALGSLCFLLGVTHAVGNEYDKTLIALALGHFYSRDDASLVASAKQLLIEPQTRLVKPEHAELALTLRGAKNNCKGLLSFRDEFARRNGQSVSVNQLVKPDERWFIASEDASKRELFFMREHQVRSEVSLLFPAYNKDSTSAILQFSFTWSIHGAIATYGFVNNGGKWKISCSDLIHFM